MIRIIVNRKRTTGNPPGYLEIRDDKFATGRANIRSSIPVRIDRITEQDDISGRTQRPARLPPTGSYSRTHAHSEQERSMQKDFSHDEKLSESRLLHQQCSYCGTLVRFNISWNESFLARNFSPVKEKRNQRFEKRYISKLSNFSLIYEFLDAFKSARFLNKSLYR